ncbi:hypothetical protein E6C50_03540 [Flavobacterium supellecticarium]|uniref:Uncharacterized protein n=1 Tax=Flavobacterium supellecticarium TaxID=2565924 RepID=A0A4V3W906_9FLAO|nr:MULTISPECIES: hypothetical protein [Flavobacterium]THF53286.1 hypothetical protein E6C50_03540 [Flavobacterium supellecticarium]
MGLFSNSEKKIIEEFSRKSEDRCNDIEKEINELLEDLKSEYEENRGVVYEFKDYVTELSNKLSPEDINRLMDFSLRLSRIKRCAKKGVEALREISRDQKKMTRETLRDYEEYFYMH